MQPSSLSYLVPSIVVLAVADIHPSVLHPGLGGLSTTAVGELCVLVALLVPERSLVGVEPLDTLLPDVPTGHN